MDGKWPFPSPGSLPFTATLASWEPEARLWRAGPGVTDLYLNPDFNRYSVTLDIILSSFITCGKELTNNTIYIVAVCED